MNLLQQIVAASPDTRYRRVGYGRLMPFTLLSRYVAREVIVPAVLALAIIGFLAVAVEFREKLAFIAVEYLTAMDVVKLLACFLPTLVTFVIPITYMMGVLLAFGGLSQNNEITAMKASGIPLKRVMAPVITLGALLSAGSFVLQDWVQPAALKTANQLMFVELPLRISLETLPTGRMNEFGNWRVYIRERDEETRTLRQVDILEEKPDGSVWAYWAESAQVIGTGANKRVIMKNCHLIMPDAGHGPMTMVLDDAELTLPAVKSDKIRNRRRTLSLSELLDEERQASASRAQADTVNVRDDLRSIRWEIADRIALSLSCLAVSLLAAPLAVRGYRSGRSYSFAIGFTLILAYQVLRLLMEPETLMPLSLNILWGSVPNLAVAAAGIWALWRVDRV